MVYAGRLRASLSIFESCGGGHILPPTQAWHEWDGTTGSVHLRLSKLLRVGGPCLLVEVDASRSGPQASMGPRGGDSDAGAAPGCRAPPTWAFVRIAPIAAPREARWRIGPFAAAPVAGGFEATFRHFALGPDAPPSHDADASAMV